MISAVRPDRARPRLPGGDQRMIPLRRARHPGRVEGLGGESSTRLRVTRLNPLPGRGRVPGHRADRPRRDPLLRPGPRASCFAAARARPLHRPPRPHIRSPGRRAGARSTRSSVRQAGLDLGLVDDSRARLRRSLGGAPAQARVPGPPVASRQPPAVHRRRLNGRCAWNRRDLSGSLAPGPLSATIRSERDFLTGPVSPGTPAVRRSTSGALEATSVSTLEPPDGPATPTRGERPQEGSTPEHFEGVLTVVDPLRPMTVHRPSGGRVWAGWLTRDAFLRARS